jgi:hypothetical protein
MLPRELETCFSEVNPRDRFFQDFGIRFSRGQKDGSGRTQIWAWLTFREGEDIMISKVLTWVAAIASIVVLGTKNVDAIENESRTAVGIPARTVADLLHAVIMAHRNFYTIHIVDRLAQDGIIDVSENWRATNSLPLPVQFLQETSELAELTGVKVRYHLISEWPINKANGPATEFERRGLKEIQTHPDRVYSDILGRGGEEFFGAIYPDRALTRMCIDCHNLHPNSPKSDFELDDVMGGLVITFPLNQAESAK